MYVYQWFDQTSNQVVGHSDTSFSWRYKQPKDANFGCHDMPNVVLKYNHTRTNEVCMFGHYNG